VLCSYGRSFLVGCSGWEATKRIGCGGEAFIKPKTFWDGGKFIVSLESSTSG